MEKRPEGAPRVDDPPAAAPPCATIDAVGFQFGSFPLDDKLFVLSCPDGPGAAA